MNLIQIVKLAKTIQKFAEINTDNGVLIIDGDLAEGVDVVIEKDGEVVPAPDGEYISDDNKIITIVSGKVDSITDKVEEPAPEEVQEEEEPAPAEPVEEPADDKDAKIKELEDKIAELEAENEDLKKQLNTANEQLSKPVVKPAKKTTVKSPFKKNYLK